MGKILMLKVNHLLIGFDQEYCTAQYKLYKENRSNDKEIWLPLLNKPV
jgi:hypothetical protein